MSFGKALNSHKVESVEYIFIQTTEDLHFGSPQKHVKAQSDEMCYINNRFPEK